MTFQHQVVLTLTLSQVQRRSQWLVSPQKSKERFSSIPTVGILLLTMAPFSILRNERRMMIHLLYRL
uniref:Uncharacterized protein n=1 Tax=Anguilla anguilla TaxID=7936 RepID=A0A0E9VNN8_ANGAN